MIVKILPGRLEGRVRAVASKSDAHRLLILAALAHGETLVRMRETSEDVEATARVLRALGAGVERVDEGYRVRAIDEPARGAVCDCGESGSTLRFCLPVAAAVGAEAVFVGAERLAARPLGELVDALRGGGATLGGERLPVRVSGGLQTREFRLSGGVSSQYASGLLMALAASGGGCLTLDRAPVSGGYVALTVRRLRDFGCEVKCFGGAGCGVGGVVENADELRASGDAAYAAAEREAEGRSGCGRVGREAVSARETASSSGFCETSREAVSARETAEADGFCETSREAVRFEVAGELRSPGELEAEGDHSAAAFWLEANALGADVAVDGLDVKSCQPDRNMSVLLEKLGKKLDVDAWPDLFPALAFAACGADAPTEFVGGARLRTKESDRIAAVAAAIRAMGGVCRETDAGLVVYPARLRGGEVDGAGDHRIVMAAAVAATAAGAATIIRGAECVAKSYPAFFEDLRSLGGKCDVV